VIPAEASAKISFRLVEGQNPKRIRKAFREYVLARLPADCRAEVDLEVTGTDDEDDESSIRADFPGLSVTRRPGTQRMTGTINGGGEKIVVRTSSGTIRLRKPVGAP